MRLPKNAMHITQCLDVEEAVAVAVAVAVGVGGLRSEWNPGRVALGESHTGEALPLARQDTFTNSKLHFFLPKNTGTSHAGHIRNSKIHFSRVLNTL